MSHSTPESVHTPDDDDHQRSSSPDPFTQGEDEAGSVSDAFTDPGTDEEPGQYQEPKPGPEEVEVDQGHEQEPEEVNQTGVEPMQTDDEEGATGVIEVSFNANLKSRQNAVTGSAREAFAPHKGDPRVKALLNVKRGTPAHRMVKLIGAVMGVHGVMASPIASSYINRFLMDASLRIHRSAVRLNSLASTLKTKRASKTRSRATVSRLERLGVRTKKEQNKLESTRTKIVDLETEVAFHQAEVDKQFTMAGFTQPPAQVGGPAQ